MWISIRRLGACAPGLLLPACLLVAGCDSAPPTVNAEAGSKQAEPANAAQASAPKHGLQATAAPTFVPPTYDRYPARTPTYDSNVQQAAHAAATDPTKPSWKAPWPAIGVSQNVPVPAPQDSGASPEFVPAVEDLQLFEQPNLNSYGKGPATAPQGFSNAEMLNWTVKPTVRPNPLPYSP